MNELFNWVQKHWQGDLGIMIRVTIIILLVAIIYAIVGFIVKRLARQFAKTKHQWGAALLQAAGLPISVAIWLIGISYAAQLANIELKNPSIAHVIQPMRTAMIVAVLFWFLFRFINLVVDIYLSDKHPTKLDKTTTHAISRLMKAVVLVIGGLVLLQTVGVPITGLLAFGGVGAAGIAFAAQDLLGNLFGGLMVYMNRPFSVGDWINSPDREIEGTVEEIGWLITRIRSFDKRPIYVPNSAFSKITIVNPSRMTNRRIKAVVGLRYQDSDKVKHITPAIQAMLKQHPDIDDKMVCFVNLVEFASSSLDILIYCFTKTTDWVKFQQVQENVFLKIIDIVHQHDADMAFPTQTLDTNGPLQIAGVN